MACLNPSTGLCEGGSLATAAIVGHNPFDADAVLAELADGALADLEVGRLRLHQTAFFVNTADHQGSNMGVVLEFLWAFIRVAPQTVCFSTTSLKVLSPNEQPA